MFIMSGDKMKNKMKMKDEDVYKVIDMIRKIKMPYSDRVANYIEANVKEIIECYERDEG
jgi:hypothetical protein